MSVDYMKKHCGLWGLKGLAYSANEISKSKNCKFLPFSKVENNERQDEKQDAYTHPDTNKHFLGHICNINHYVSFVPTENT
jgi:hypothetical protein